MTSKRKTFPAEFKFEAVRQLEAKEITAAELARKLGIPRNRLYKWQEAILKHGDDAFPGHGGRRTNSRDPEVRQKSDHAALQREVARLKEENAILKKAAAFFARELP